MCASCTYRDVITIIIVLCVPYTTNPTPYPVSPYPKNKGCDSSKKPPTLFLFGFAYLFIECIAHTTAWSCTFYINRNIKIHLAEVISVVKDFLRREGGPRHDDRLGGLMSLCAPEFVCLSCRGKCAIA